MAAMPSRLYARNKEIRNFQCVRSFVMNFRSSASVCTRSSFTSILSHTRYVCVLVPCTKELKNFVVDVCAHPLHTFIINFFFHCRFRRRQSWRRRPSAARRTLYACYHYTYTATYSMIRNFCRDCWTSFRCSWKKFSFLFSSKQHCVDCASLSSPLVRVAHCHQAMHSAEP